MTIKEADRWLTDARLVRINHERERAGEDPASREILVRFIASLKGDALRFALDRYD